MRLIAEYEVRRWVTGVVANDLDGSTESREGCGGDLVVAGNS